MSRPEEREPDTDATRPSFRPAARPADDLPDIPRVKVVRILGRGGMGLVFEGIQEFLERRVAVKVVARELLSDDFTERFRREAQILGELKHPNIVTCFDSGLTADGLAYMVMEYVDGPGTLRQWTSENGPMSPSIALDMCASLADALNHAWGHGIIHRDVKPDNVLFQRLDGTAARRPGRFHLVPKLIDLGIARAVERDRLTEAGMVVGTMSTMAPEQIEYPAEVDYRADIYGLGCVLYQALTGHAAFDGPTGVVLDRKRRAIPDPRTFRDMPDGVADLVRAMLAYDRTQRPQSYREIIETCLRMSGSSQTAARTSQIRARLDSPEADNPHAPAAPTEPVTLTVTETRTPAGSGRRGWAVGSASVAFLALLTASWLLWGDRISKAIDGAAPPASTAARFTVAIDNDVALPDVLTARDSTGRGFLYPSIARRAGAEAPLATEGLPFEALMPEFQAGKIGVWEGRGSYLVPLVGDQLCVIAPDLHQLPADHELLCRLQLRLGEAVPEIAGLVIDVPGVARFLIGMETIDADPVRCRALVSRAPRADELAQLELARMRSGATSEWLLDPIVDATRRTVASVDLQPAADTDLEIRRGYLGSTILLYVRVRTDATGLKLQFGDDLDAREIDIRLSDPLGATGVGVGTLVNKGKAWFHHLHCRRLPPPPR